MSALQRKDEMPEGVYVPQVDFDMLLWMALQNCLNAPLFGKYDQSFRDCVVMFQSLIESNPNYMDSEYKDAAKGQAINFLSAGIALMHRKKFFDKPTKDMGHL